MNDGNSLFNITSNIVFYFTSAEAGHCQKNQKLRVVVGDGNGVLPSDGPTASLPENAAGEPSYPTVDKTLKELQLEYLDLYLIHWPVRMKKGSVGFKPENLTETNIRSTWRAMEAAYDSGKARAIGLKSAGALVKHSISCEVVV